MPSLEAKEQYSVDRNDTTVDGRDNCIGQVADGTSLRGGMSYGMEGEDVRCRSGDERKTLLEYDNLQRNLYRGDVQGTERFILHLIGVDTQLA